MRQPIEAFAWGQTRYTPDVLVGDNDPAVRKFPHLFVPLDEPEKRFRKAQG